MARLQFPRQDAILPVSFRSRPGASWRGVRPLEALGFSRGRCHQRTLRLTERRNMPARLEALAHHRGGVLTISRMGRRTAERLRTALGF